MVIPRGAVAAVAMVFLQRTTPHELCQIIKALLTKQLRVGDTALGLCMCMLVGITFPPLAESNHLNTLTFQLQSTHRSVLIDDELPKLTFLL